MANKHTRQNASRWQKHVLATPPLPGHLSFLPLAVFAIFCFLITGCASQHTQRTIRDLQTIPQNASVTSWGLLPGNATLLTDQDRLGRDYLTRVFAPWHVNATSMYAPEKLFGATTGFQGKSLIGENLQPWAAGRLEALAGQCDMSSFPNADIRAITIRDTNLRALPTNHPAFYPFDRPGEGYPFDYLQYSTLWAGTPIHICHISQNKAWALVESGFVYGWMPVPDLAIADASFATRFQGQHFAIPLKDNVPLVDTEGVYRFMTHIGALYPVESDDQGQGRLLLPTADDSRHAVMVRADIPPDNLAAFPLPQTPKNQTGLADQLLGQSYGWGGMYFNRDCSAMTRDFMASFGIWLPRNSSQQARQGQRVDLADLPGVQKEKIIREQGLPFRTLIWMPGHVTLYIGQYQGHALIMHNTWGLKTRTWSGREGRHVIGRTVITTLTPGAELRDLDRPKGLLINKVTGMSILP